MVASSGFGNGAIDALNGAGIRPKPASQQPSNGANAPVEITFKPKPDYTDEGESKKLTEKFAWKSCSDPTGKSTSYGCCKGWGTDWMRRP